ncbi:MAG: hypothetical protein LBW85_09400 [Deltaproteobacteria bacterium]|nr:hypothetical protein [Deltaproteobacteria bacterium]
MPRLASRDFPPRPPASAEGLDAAPPAPGAPGQGAGGAPSEAGPRRGAAAGPGPAEGREPPLGLSPHFGERFRKSFLFSFRRNLLTSFGPPFLADVRRFQDSEEARPEFKRRGPPGSEAFRMAYRLSFVEAWQGSFPAAFREAMRRALYPPRPSSHRRGFRRDLRSGLRRALASPFKRVMLLHLRRGYFWIMGPYVDGAFRRNFARAYGEAFHAAFRKAFRDAWP